MIKRSRNDLGTGDCSIDAESKLGTSGCAKEGTRSKIAIRQLLYKAQAQPRQMIARCTDVLMAALGSHPSSPGS